MTDGLTVIYYTNNKEKPAFAERIQKKLLENIGDLPLVSVSQKPMEFGHNICVGDVGSSTQNTWRQFHIGAQEAKTRFVATAEADCLYPPEYFQHRPPDENVIAYAKPMWLAYARKTPIYIPKRAGSFGASIMGRKQAIDAMEKILAPIGYWGDIDERDPVLDIFRYMSRVFFVIPHNIVSFKTNENLHHHPARYRGICTYLPDLGEVDALMQEYMAP